MKKKEIIKELTMLILITIIVFVAFGFYNKSRYYEPAVQFDEEIEGDEWDMDIPEL